MQWQTQKLVWCLKSVARQTMFEIVRMVRRFFLLLSISFRKLVKRLSVYQSDVSCLVNQQSIIFISYFAEVILANHSFGYSCTCIGNSMICSDIWHKYHEWSFKIVIMKFETITSGIYAKYHVQIMLLIVYITTLKRFVISTCRYFKLSWNTTALSQSNCRNVWCRSINTVITSLIVILVTWRSCYFPICPFVSLALQLISWIVTEVTVTNEPN